MCLALSSCTLIMKYGMGVSFAGLIWALVGAQTGFCATEEVQSGESLQNIFLHIKREQHHYGKVEYEVACSSQDRPGMDPCYVLRTVNDTKSASWRISADEARKWQKAF